MANEIFHHAFYSYFFLYVLVEELFRISNLEFVHRTILSGVIELLLFSVDPLDNIEELHDESSMSYYQDSCFLFSFIFD